MLRELKLKNTIVKYGLNKNGIEQSFAQMYNHIALSNPGGAAAKRWEKAVSAKSNLNSAMANAKKYEKWTENTVNWAFTGYDLAMRFRNWQQYSGIFDSMTSELLGNCAPEETSALRENIKREKTHMTNQKLTMGLCVVAVAAYVTFPLSLVAGAAIAATDAIYTNNTNSKIKELKYEANQLGCLDFDDQGGRLAPRVGVRLDPSGYVYEAVPSNRLPAVSTTVFFKTIEQNIYGDDIEVIKKWNAVDYGLENPQVTDKYGLYGWDVPLGLWQVKYEKDGFQTAYSDWLPVPPPQLDVNIGMVSYAQPTVERINGYEDYLEAVFDKYMDITTITGTNITVIRNGTPIDIDIEFVDEEADPRNEDHFYAKIVHFKPLTASFDTNDTVVLSISKAASSYADVEMASDYTQTVPIKPEPKLLVLPSEINLAYGESKTLEVSLLPLDAAANKKITAVSGSTYLVAVNAEAVTDTAGVAAFSVTGELPGSTKLIFYVDGTLISKSAKVNVALPDQPSDDKAAKPTSNISSGEVAKGTLLTFSTTTPDATIYYTLDGSCPCAEDGPRKVYNGPIEINEDMMILAAAYKEGMDYSDTLGLFFMVKPAHPGVTVSGQVKTYNPAKSAHLELRGARTYTYDTPIGSGSGQLTQNFTFPGVEPGAYRLVITKDAHTSFTVYNIVVADKDVDLTGDARPEVQLMTMRCGDINGDGNINNSDLTILWQQANYNRSAAAAANKLCDLNGDGLINNIDLTILWLAYNYNRGPVEIQ
jgi:hypothetical protein